MPIIRIKKRDNPFVQIDKKVIADEDLSWKAKGLLCYLLSKPDDWEVKVSHLKKQSTDGRDSTRTALNELIDAGYISKQRKHKDDGKFDGFEYLVFESPNIASQSIYGKSVNGKTVYGKTVYGESDTTNKELNNNELNNNEKRSSARARDVESESDNPSPSLVDRLQYANTARELHRLWIEYKKQVHGADPGEVEQQQSFEQIKDWGVAQARAIIEVAFANGYQGLKRSYIF